MFVDCRMGIFLVKGWAVQINKDAWFVTHSEGTGSHVECYQDKEEPVGQSRWERWIHCTLCKWENKQTAGSGGKRQVSCASEAGASVLSSQVACDIESPGFVLPGPSEAVSRKRLSSIRTAAAPREDVLFCFHRFNNSQSKSKIWFHVRWWTLDVNFRFMLESFMWRSNICVRFCYAIKNQPNNLTSWTLVRTNILS